MSVYRVLWHVGDNTNGGQWLDVTADDEANATWQAAVTAGQGSTFLAVAALPSAE